MRVSIHSVTERTNLVEFKPTPTINLATDAGRRQFATEMAVHLYGMPASEVKSNTSLSSGYGFYGRILLAIDAFAEGYQALTGIEFNYQKVDHGYPTTVQRVIDLLAYLLGPSA